MSPWEEVEADPDFSNLAPTDKAALFDNWHQATVEGFHNDLDPEQIDSAGMRGFLASGQAKRRQLLGEQVTPEQAVKEFDQGLKTRTESQQKALKDYDELETSRYALKDAAAFRGISSSMDRGLPMDPRTTAILDKPRQEAQAKVDEVKSRFAPDVERQAKEARAAIRGEIPVAVLGGDIYTDPTLTLDKEAYRKAVQSTDAPAESKLLALAEFNNRRDKFAKDALRAFTIAGDEAPLPGMMTFPKWEATQPAEVRAKPPEAKVLDYLRVMKDRPAYQKLLSAIATGAVQGGADVASQGIGLVAMTTGSDALAKQAGQVEEGNQTITDVQKLEGDNTATGATTVGGVSRMGVGMAPAIGAGLLAGGSLTAAALAAGAQTAGAQFPTTYNAMIEQGKTPEEALSSSRGAALLSGAITAGLTAMGGKSGIEAILRTGGANAARSKLKSVLLTGPLKEIIEELPDEQASQIIEASLTNPDKPVSQVVDEFLAKAPELALQVGILGGAGEVFSKGGSATETAPAEQQRTPVNSAGLGRTVAEVTAESDALSAQAAQQAVAADSPLLAEAIVENAAAPTPEADKVAETGTTEPVVQEPGATGEVTNEAPAEQEVKATNNPRLARFSDDELQARWQIADTRSQELGNPMAPVWADEAKMLSQEIGLRQSQVSSTGINDEAAYQEARAKAIKDAEEIVARKARNTDLFPDKTDFMGKLSHEATLSSYQERNGFGVAEYANPTTGLTDVYLAAFGDNDFIAYIRVYDENGKPTNQFTSKLERRSKAPGVTKAMLADLQSRLPEGHEYTEDVSVSTDGLKFIASQLNQGYEVATDQNGKPQTREVAISGESLVNDLPINVDPNGKFENIRITNRKDFDKVRPVLGKMLERFGVGLGEQNVHWENGTAFIDIPVLRKKPSATAQQSPQAVTTNDAATPLEQGGSDAFAGEPRTPSEGSIPDVTVENVPDNKPLSTGEQSTVAPDGYSLKYENKDGKHTVSAFDANGNRVGTGRFVEKGVGLKYEPGGILYVEPQHRRKGIASAIYNKVEEATGMKIAPSPITTGEGAAFESNRKRTQSSATPSTEAPTKSTPDRINESSLSPRTTYPTLVQDIKNLTGNNATQLQEVADALLPEPMNRPTAEKIARRLMDENQAEREVNAKRDRDLERDILGEEKAQRGDEKPITDSKAPVAQGEFVTWQAEDGTMREGVLTKTNAGRNSAGEAVSEVTLESSELVQVPRRELQTLASERPTMSARDVEYMAAVEAGNMEKAQRMVDEAAKAAGYDREAFKAMPEKDWRTDEPINVIKSTNGPWAGFFTDTKGAADRFGRIMRQPVRRAFLKLTKPFEVDASGKAAGEVQFDILDDSGAHAQKNNTEILAAIDSGRYDSIVLKNTTDEGTVMVPLKPSQIKSADPITRDADGNVIPLSQRFNSASDDIRFSLARTPAQQARAEAIKSIRGTLGTELSTGVSAVDAINGATDLQGQVPGVQKAWVGTRADFLADEKLGKSFPQVKRALESGKGDRLEGLFSAGRAFVFTDQVGIYEGDVASAAEQEGVTPGQAAVQRVITHEALVHRGFYALDKPTRRALFQWGAQNIYEGEMDAKAEEYGSGADWRTNVDSREFLLEEIMAKMIERLKSPPKSGPLKQLWDILAAIWRKLSGKSREVTLKDVQDVAKLLRTALELAENNVETRSGMPIRVEVAKPSMANRRGFMKMLVGSLAASGLSHADESLADAMKNTGTKLSPEQEVAFQEWKKKYAPLDNGSDYDLRGAFLEGITPDGERGHFPDTYKLPNHPTFSKESKYSTPTHMGGEWSESNGHTTFTPSKWMMGDHVRMAELKAYFKEVEPDSELIIPKDESPARPSIRPQYTTPLDQTLANTAKAVRLMRDGPPAVPVNMQQVYQAAVKGKPSTMVSLDDLFATAKQVHPELTEAEFGQQVQALYDDNGAYIEPAESVDMMKADGEKYGVRSPNGVPASFVMVLDDEPVRASYRGEKDAEYMAAVEAGDMEKAQRMVDEAAKAAGYGVGPVYHGSPETRITEFKTVAPPRKTGDASDSALGSFFTDNIPATKQFYSINEVNPMTGGLKQTPFGRIYRVFIGGNLAKLTDSLMQEVADAVSYPSDGYWDRDAWRNMSQVTNFAGANAVREFLIGRGFSGVYVKTSVDSVTKAKTKSGYQQITQYAVFSPSQIKSADPVTRDAEGNVIPLSQRFNTASDDIRFSLRPETVTRLNRVVEAAQNASGDITDSEQTPIKDRPTHTFAQQSGEARVGAAVQIVDALEAEGTPKEELVDVLTGYELHKQLGIEKDPDMLSILLAEAMSRGAPGAFDAYEVTRERAGRALGSGAMLHTHPRYKHLFALNGIKKEHQDVADNIAKANADIKADEVKKLDAEASQTAAKELAESAEEAAFRQGEESLSAEDKPLWQKIKDRITRIGFALQKLAGLEAKSDTNTKASLAGNVSYAELAAMDKMTAEQLRAFIADEQKALTADLKKMMGKGPKAKANPQAGRIATLVNRLSEQLGVPTDITTAVEALTASQDTLRNQFEQSIVDSLVNKTRAAITPKKAPSKNLNSVIRQITRILADNLNLPKNTTGAESLGEKAIDAFGRVRNNEQLIREAWEKAREQIRVELAKRATEGLEGLTEEEAAEIGNLVDEQIASIAAEVPARLWARGQAFSVLRDALADTTFDSNAQILADPAGALKAARDKINQAVEKVGNVDPARWDSNQSYIIAAFNQLVEDLQAAKAKSDKRRRAAQKAGVFSPAEAKTFNRLMDQAHKRSGDKSPMLPENISWTKLFSGSPQSQEAKAKQMMEYMKQDPVLSNLTPEEQQELADMFSKRWEAKREELTAAKVAAVLKRRFATEKGKQAVKGAIPKFIQAINRGELNNDIIAQDIAEKFGFEKLTDAENKKLETLAKELQEPNISVHDRRAKTDEIVKIIARKTGLSTAEILSAWWVTSVLSGPRTIFTIGMAFLSGGFEVFTHAAATVINAHLQGRRGEGTEAAMQSLTNYFKSYPRAVQLAWQYVRTGDKNLLADSDPAFMQFFDTGRNNPQSIGWRMTQSKNPATRMLGRFMHFFEKMLTAGDLFNSTITRHGMLPVAQFLNSKTYEKARVASETDLSNYRKKALRDWWGDEEPKTWKEQALVTRQSIDLMEAVLAKYANVLEDANFVAAQGAMTLNPEGLGGKAYRAIRGIANRAETSSAKATKAADMLKAEKVGAINKKTQQVIAFLYHFATHQMLNLGGLRFARFAGNKLNQSIGFIPMLGLARLYEKDYAGQMKQQAIIKNQVIGAVIAMVGITILKAISDEPDDDKRGWGIEGSWAGLSAAKIKQLMAAGRKQNSLHFGGNTFNYANWPISSMLAAIGAMSDRIKYDPEDWEKATTPEVAYTGLWAAMSSTFDTTALSQLSEILGSNVHSRDPVDASMKKMSRIFGNFAGGFIPRVLKDVDLMGDGNLRKYEGWENFAKEVPYYRRYVGGPLLDIFGQQVEVDRSPWSREYQAQPEAREYQLLGQMGSNGLWLTPADPGNRRVGKGRRSREMTDAEQKRFVSIVGENYRQLVLKHGDRLNGMKHEAAKDMLGKLSDVARDRAERAALAAPPEAQP